MRNIYLGLMLLFSVTLSAQNYTLFEADTRIFDNIEVTSISHYGEFAITDKFGVVDYVSVTTKALDEALVGLYFRPIENITIGALIGLHTDAPDAVRLGAMGYYQNDYLLISLFYERDDNFIDGAYEWYDLQARYEFYTGTQNSFYIGSRYKTGYGVGLPLTVRQTVGKSDFYLYYTTYYNEDVGDEWLPTIGLQLIF